MWGSRRPAVLAVILSFSVYLLPLIGPHSLTLLGHGLILELTSDMNRSAAWIMTDIALALLLQTAACTLIYWFIRKPRLVAGIALVIAIPVFIAVAEVGYLLAIPSMFLIERDASPESAGWPAVCSAEDATLISVPMPQNRSGAAISEFIVQSAKGLNRLIRFSGCETAPLALPQPTVQPDGRVDFMVGISYFVPGTAILFHKMEPATGKMHWEFLEEGKDAVPIDITARAPVLSLNGRWVGWVDRENGSGPRPSSVFGRRFEDATPSVKIDLSAYGIASEYFLIAFDVEKQQALIARNDYSKYVFLTIGFDGAQLSSTEPDDVKPQPQTFWKMPEGWIAWDAYQERDRYRVRWSLAGGSGSHRVLLGRSITAVAANPSGSLIAVSVSTSLNIGNIADSVYILRASDGSEVFRKYLPMYSRSNVLFPSDQLFAYSADGKTLVLKVPEAP